MKLAHTNTEDVTQALASDLPDLEDAILYYTAITNECDMFVTQNTKDFPDTDMLIEVLTPQDFLLK